MQRTTFCVLPLRHAVHDLRALMRQRLSCLDPCRQKRGKRQVLACVKRSDWLAKTGEDAQGKRRTAEDHHQVWNLPDVTYIELHCDYGYLKTTRCC
ncbi:hypothetical protein M3J09_007538 [Ascochyta lentis]